MDMQELKQRLVEEYEAMETVKPISFVEWLIERYAMVINENVRLKAKFQHETANSDRIVRFEDDIKVMRTRIVVEPLYGEEYTYFQIFESHNAFEVNDLPILQGFGTRKMWNEIFSLLMESYKQKAVQ